MYPRASTASGIAGTGVLAETGISVGWSIMLGMMLIVLGMVVFRLVPRAETATAGHRRHARRSEAQQPRRR